VAPRKPQPASDLTNYLDELRAGIEDALGRVLPVEISPPLVIDSMRYALMGGGKRLRPCLTLAVAESVGRQQAIGASDARLLALPSACAVEMVHAYSLVHDDLPAMDNDSMRRGRPTTHVTYGEGMAVLAGDGLLTEAFAVLSRSPSPVLPPGSPEPPIHRRMHALAILSFAAGAAGMVGGQGIDLAAAGRVKGAKRSTFDQTALEDMHARKTGALIRAAATMGAVAVGAEAALIARIDAYARDLGLAFQIVDDLLDVEGSNEKLGKTAGKDAKAGKPTYPAILGVKKSRALAAECTERAKAAATEAGFEGRLVQIAEWILKRSS
jgi:geranylgeranyl pyrophosphate synthase